MLHRYEQRCFIKIQVAREKNVSKCIRALQEPCGREILPYRTIARWVEAFHQGTDEHLLVDPLLQQTISMFRL